MSQRQAGIVARLRMLVVAAMLSGLPTGCGAGGEPQRKGPQQTEVAVEVAYPLGWVRTTLLRRFRSSAVDDRDRLAAFDLVPAAGGTEVPGRPSDAALARWRALDPALERYLALDPALQADDLYLFEPVGTLWWEDDYHLHGRPVDFRSAYLLHLRALDPDSTRVEVMQLMPQVRLGRRWALGAHSIAPARVADIRAVAPTTGDRQRVLERVVRVLAQAAGDTPAM